MLYTVLHIMRYYSEYVLGIVVVHLGRMKLHKVAKTKKLSYIMAYRNLVT